MLGFKPHKFDSDQSFDHRYTLIACVFYSVLCFLSSGIPFFSDNLTLVSRVAHYFYFSNFESLILPNEIDTGHPPFYGLLLASIWKTFGYKLWLSHVLILPFCVGALYFFLRISQLFIGNKNLPYAFLLFISEPIILGQSVLAGLDIVLLCSFFMALYGILSKKFFWKSIGLILLASLSLRGVIACILLGISELVFTLVFYEREDSLEKNKNHLFISAKEYVVAYLPALVFVLIWYSYHLKEAGFFVFNYKSTWAEDYELVNPFGFIWNALIATWRFLDQGRVFVWLIIFGAFLNCRNREKSQGNRSKRELDPKLVSLLIFTVLPLLVYVPIVIYRTIPIVHRYFLPFYLLISLLGLYLLCSSKGRLFHYKKQLVGFLVVMQLLGHLWIYPQPIANSWDSSLAYIPYLKQMEKMRLYLDNNSIDYQKVGSQFPAVGTKRLAYLEADDRLFAQMDYKDFEEHQFVLESNLMNEFDLELKEVLERSWILEKEFISCVSYLRLYRNPEEK